MKMDDTFLTYSALDSACMMQIHDAFWEDVEKGGYNNTYNMTISLFPVLAFMQTRGMKVDKTLLDETRKEVIEKTAQKQAELDELVGHPLNVNSSKQCIAYFYGELQLQPITCGKTKRVTTDDSAMQRLVRGKIGQPPVPAAKLVQEIRALKKLHGTYLDIAFDEDGRMRGAYNPRGTKFGRLSSSKTVFDTGMNFQNLPSEFKKFLVADPGYVLMEVDKRQAEWVVVAYHANDVNMIKAIEDGVDVHAHTASLMFNLPLELIEHENKIVGHATDAEKIKELRLSDSILREAMDDTWPRTMSLRQCGKKSNHGLNYDERAYNFSLINEMSITEGKRIVSLYHEIYPGIRMSYDVIKRQLQENRTLTNCFGRKVRFMGEWGNDMWKSAYSFIPQSTVVDSLNQGMVRIYNDEMITRAANLDILAQVHDSILLQIPIEVAKQPELLIHLYNKITKYITPTLSYHGNSFTIGTDAKIGLNWGAFNQQTNKLGMRDFETYTDMENLLEDAEKVGHEGIE